MTLEVAIRRAEVSDARAIAALSRSEIEYGLPPSWTPVRVARLLSRPETNAYGLCLEGGLGGFSIASFGERSGHLVLLAVAPGLRRRGLGRRLLSWQLEAGLVAGLERFTLEVRAGNRAAIALYRSSGFQLVRRLEHYYSNGESALKFSLSPLQNGLAPAL